MAGGGGGEDNIDNNERRQWYSRKSQRRQPQGGRSNGAQGNTSHQHHQQQQQPPPLAEYSRRDTTRETRESAPASPVARPLPPLPSRVPTFFFSFVYGRQRQALTSTDLQCFSTVLGVKISMVRPTTPAELDNNRSFSLQRTLGALTASTVSDGACQSSCPQQNQTHTKCLARSDEFRLTIKWVRWEHGLTYQWYSSTTLSTKVANRSYQS